MILYQMHRKHESDWREMLLKLGSRVKAQRKILGLSQGKLGEMAGLHRTYVADIERGARNLTFLNLARLAEPLQMSVSELCHGIVRARKNLAKEEDSSRDLRQEAA